MSRSEYVDDLDQWSLIMWRGAVKSAIRGKRGQLLLTEMLTALDAMPVKELIPNELEHKGQYCALGVVGKSRGMSLEDIDPYEDSEVSEAFNIAGALAREIVFMNDEAGLYKETNEARWSRMRAWVSEQIAA